MATEAPLFQPFPMLPGRRAQVWRHQPAYRRPRHFHAEPEVNLVLHGRASLGLGRKTITLAKGDALVFHPGQDHELIEASDDLDLFVFAVTPALAAHLDGWLTATRAVRVRPERLAAINATLTSLHTLANEQAVELQVMSALREVIEAATSSVRAVDRRAFALIGRQRGLSGVEVATRLHSSRSELSRHFHRAVGTTFVEFRSRLRLIEFIRLVDAGRSMTQAALEADFGSYVQCFRVFQNTLGCSPRAYFGGNREQIASATWGASDFATFGGQSSATF